MNIEEFKTFMQQRAEELQRLAKSQTNALQQHLAEKRDQLSAFVEKLNHSSEALNIQLTQSEHVMNELNHGLDLSEELNGFYQHIEKEGLSETDIIELNHRTEFLLQEKARIHTNVNKAKAESALQAMDSALHAMHELLRLKNSKTATLMHNMKGAVETYLPKVKHWLANQFEWCANKLRA